MSSRALSRTVSKKPLVFLNRDGDRVEDGRYAVLVKAVCEFVPASRVITDALRTFAFGSDASFYRLTPKVVIKVHTETEVRRILPLAAMHGTPITFRAAGTSLSGQAISDSVLLKTSHVGRLPWRRYEVLDDGREITLEPSITGGEANRALAAYQLKARLPQRFKLGPDPSSLEAAMIGGIVSNNASGSCCGVSQNSYHTVKDLRLVFVDGSVLDTGDVASVAAWSESHSDILAAVTALAKRVQADAPLAALIRKKFAIKCTTGYSINALVDFPADKPVEIIKRLIIGSEGTLAFISRATFNTVPEFPSKSSALVLFPGAHGLADACNAAHVLRDRTSVDAVELLDHTCLAGAARVPAMLALHPSLSNDAAGGSAALLIEACASGPQELAAKEASVRAAIGYSAAGNAGNEPPAVVFSDDPTVISTLWGVRKNLRALVGTSRRPGQVMLSEDVACDAASLAGLASDLLNMFKKNGYEGAALFGHALEGNLHLIFPQAFDEQNEVRRYGSMMPELCEIVAEKHGGSLKAEHGTGRNIAAFVEMEWGSTATGLMWELKDIFDPQNVLNPGVILNRDHDAHVKSLKLSPPAHPIIDACIECGLCESSCPSRDTSLTPRQRITVFREMARVRGLAEPTAEEKARLIDLAAGFRYEGEATCAADGMCEVKCPVKINTGDLIKAIREDDVAAGSPLTTSLAIAAASRFGAFVTATRATLWVLDAADRIVGPAPLIAVSRALNWLSGRRVPVYSPFFPTPARPLPVIKARP